MHITGCPHVKCIVGKHTKFNAFLIVPIRCKRWTCRFCKNCNLKILLDRIRRGKPNKLVTLTCHAPPGSDPAALYARHRPAIRRLLQLIRRNFGPIEACIICEITHAGNPHWHLVARTNFIPQDWLGRQWFELTGSKIVDIRKIADARHAANYVAKYVTKTHGLNKPAWLTRVTQFTRHYAPTKKHFLPENFLFERSQLPPEHVEQRYDPTQYDRVELSCGNLFVDRAEKREPGILELADLWAKHCPT
jgi:hypothetical protein